MKYIQYMKPGGNFGDKLKTGIKKFLKAAGEASRMAKDARINNPGAAMIRDAYAKGDEELAKLLTDEMQAANLTGIALGSGAAPLITGFTITPVTTGATLATGMAGSMAGAYGTDKAINYFSDGKYTGWGNLVNQVTDGTVGESTANFFHPGAILGGAISGIVGNKIVGVTNRGKLELLNSALNKNILATTLQPTVADDHIRIKVGDVEVNDPTMMYRQGHLEMIDDFVDKGFVDRSWDPLDGSVAPQFAEGRLWYGLPNKSTRTGLLVTKQSMRPTDAATRENTPFLTTEGSATYVTDNVGRRIPMYDKLLTTSNTDAFIFKPNYGYLRINKSNPKTSLAFFERHPAKISKGERLGIPKGQERTIINNEEEILNNAKSFAEKYGYEIPETIDAAKAMYKQHNSWFRTVLVDPLYDNSKYGLAFTDPKLQTLPKTESAKILASRGYPAAYRFPGDYEPGIYLDDFVFASPSMAANAGYLGNPGTYTVMLQRPFSFRNPLDWHNAADYRPISKYIYEPLLVGLTLIGNVGPKYELKLATKHLIPVKIAQPTDKGTLLGEYLGNIEYKSGGTIKIKKKNKGKFAKVRDYVDYKNNK